MKVMMEVWCVMGCMTIFVLARTEELFLNPRDEVAAVACAEDVHRHHHHPQPEGGRHDEVFRFRDDDAVLYLGLHAVAAGIIRKRNSTQPVQKSRPPRSPQSVWRVSPLTNTPMMTITSPAKPIMKPA